MSSLTEREIKGLQEIHSLNAAFLKSGKGNQQVRDYLQKADLDEDLLLRFLIGRKYRAKYAWETLKRYAQVRFVDYPELFPKDMLDNVRLRQLAKESKIAGGLTSRDKFGRRIGVFDFGAWDPDKYSTEEISIAVCQVAEVVHTDRDTAVHGAIIIIQCKELGGRHMKEITVRTLRRTIDVFLRAYPVKLKGIFLVNVPYYFGKIATLISCFIPNKIRKRLVITTEDCFNCKPLLELVSPEQLPKCIGGPLEFYDCMEDLSQVFG